MKEEGIKEELKKSRLIVDLTIMKVLVASKNPVKINSVKIGFNRVFPNTNLVFDGISVPSDINDQPLTVEETYQGAINRINNMQKINTSADYYVGIEGGLEVFNSQYYAFAWVVVKHGSLVGKARTASFLLPPEIVKLIESGLELGAADDIVFKQKNSKQKQGAIGILTKGLIDRTGYYSTAVELALIPFINSDLF